MLEFGKTKNEGIVILDYISRVKVYFEKIGNVIFITFYPYKKNVGETVSISIELYDGIKFRSLVSKYLAPLDLPIEIIEKESMKLSVSTKNKCIAIPKTNQAAFNSLSELIINASKDMQYIDEETERRFGEFFDSNNQKGTAKQMKPISTTDTDKSK